MSTVVATAVVEVPNGPNDENIKVHQATVGAAAASDTISITMPLNADGVTSDYVGKSFSILSVRVEQWVDAAAGARTKTDVPIASFSYVETTGILSIVLGATAITGVGRAVFTVAGPVL